MDKQQRLYRLTSQTNDGVFDTLFDQDIDIPAGAEIALQSASFDRQSNQVKIDVTNRGVTFGLDTTTWSADMDEGTFSQLVDGEDMLTSTAANMNRVIDFNDQEHLVIGEDAYGYNIDKGSQWRMQLDSDGKSEITAKTYASSLISNSLYGATTAFSKTNVFAGTDKPEVVPGGVVGSLDTMSRPDGTSGDGEYNDSYIYGKVRMTKGTGCVRVRVADIVNAAGAAAPRATIGLVAGTAGLAKLEAGTLENGDIEWALQVCGKTHQYRYKQGAGTGFQNAVVPGTATLIIPENVEVVTEPDNENDVLEICIGGDGGVPAGKEQAIDMFIHQETLGKTRVGNAISIYPDQSVDWYYFVSFQQDVGEFALDMMEVDFDPYEFDQDTVVAPAGPYQRSTLVSVVRNGWGYLDGIVLGDRKGIFNWGSEEVGAFFGFANGKPDDIIGDSLAKSALYTFTSSLRSEFSVTAKNYLVLFDNLPLNSFDSYSEFDAVRRAANAGGSRRNLLATVPVKEDQIQVGSVSQVAFEPNTLNYISLQNRSTVLTRELRCRVLTSTYLPVIVDGMASLTILIRG